MESCRTGTRGENDTFDILKPLRETDDFKKLADHFLHTGRGRKPALPQLGAPTPKVLLQLFCLKNDANATWDDVTSWYHKIFPDQPLARGSLIRKIEVFLKAEDSDLDQPMVKDEFPELLSSLGLTRDLLMLGDAANFTPNDESLLITNEVVLHFDHFRSKHKLPHSFVHKWLLRLCPSYTESQMRHKASVVLKNIKQLKSKKKSAELSLFLKDSISNFVKNPSPSDTTLSLTTPTTCKCDSDINKLLDKINELEAMNKHSQEIIDSKSAELVESQRKIFTLEEDTKKSKSLTIQLKKQKSITETKSSQLVDLKSSKIYKRNVNLRKHIQKQNREKRKINQEFKDLKSNFEKTVQSLEQKITNLKKQLKSEQTMKARLKKEKLENTNIISDLLKNDADKDDMKLRTDKFNQFTDDVRLLYMSLLGESNVAAQNCNSVVQNVSKHLFHVNFSLEQLPSISTILNFANEASQIAHCHVVEKIIDSKHFTFATDGTSRQKKHYLEKHIVLDDKLSLSLGYSEVASDDSETLLEKTIEILDDLCTIYHNSSDSDKDALFKSIVRKMRCIMTDRAAVNKSYDKKLLQFKKDVLQDDECTLQFLFCNAHFLLGLVTSTEKALLKVERDLGKMGRDKDNIFDMFAGKECSAFRIIRTASDVFGPRGDEKCGCREEWLAYCKSKNIKSQFISFRTNRFNNLFENAFAVIYHNQDILTFLNSHVSHRSDLKLQSILKDLQDNKLLSVVASIGLFYKLFTGPYWKLMNSDVSYGQFAPFVSKMKDKFDFWIVGLNIDVNNDSVFDECFIVNDENVLLNFLSSSSCDQTLCKNSYIEIANHANEVLQRQLSDFLEGGVYGGELSEEIRDILDSCPLTFNRGKNFWGFRL